MGRIVYAFPGSGKTFLCSKNPNYIELSSEDYHWIKCEKSEGNKGNYKNINPSWPDNYLYAILKAKEKYEFVFITHSGSELCRKNNIHYDIVYPEIDSKQDYISRMKKRGNNIEFINNMQENFEKYCFACANDEFADEKIKLKKGEFLEDVIKKLKILNKSPLLDNYMNDNNLITTNNSTNSLRKKTKNICNALNIKFAVILFDNNFIEELINKNIGYEIGRFYSGSDYNKIIKVNNFLLVSSFLGGPNASALMEELKYYGIKYILALGTACNISETNKKNCMLVEKAIRDEGTSLFYKEPTVYAYSSKYINELLKLILEEEQIDFYSGITWTIDAYYRENLERLKKRKSQGATCIDMESSVWCSVAEYLKIDFSQLLFFTDQMKKGEWNKMKKNTEVKKEIAQLSLSISKKLVRKLEE